MFGRLLLLFTAIPLVELYLLIEIGRWLGALPTIGIVLVTGALGAYLARMQGSSVWLQIQRKMEAGIFPGDEMIDGLLIVVAGALLITPGILTDLFGFGVLFPVTRVPIREWVKRRLSRMMDRGDVHISGFVR
ncbi:MAG: FxsA family protein [Spirochaetaceae bacterium]